MGRPSFAKAWHASMQIYDPVDPLGKVARVIGGVVARNIEMKTAERWENTCAVRMSYILNQSGMVIPHIGGQNVSGSDHRWYFYRVPDVINYLTKQWGKPDLVIPFPQANGGQLSGKKGIIMFEVTGWGNASGHATLWNGTGCYDHCYFYETGLTYRTTKANFWRLP